MSRFSIDFQWLTRDFGDPVARATLAEIEMSVAELKATEVEDIWAKTVRPGVRVSAYALANWFVSNWWRLLWEPERDTSSWKMSHKVGAAGEGYLWPDLAFISDGESVLVRARPSVRVPEQPVRYLNGFDVFVPVCDFESGMHAFIEAVVGRLSDTRTSAPEFEALWKEVLAERHDPESTSWRKLEAIMGYDPGDAPEDVMASLLEAKVLFGSGAVEEIAAESMENAFSDIRVLWNETRGRSLTVEVLHLDNIRSRIMQEVGASLSPWQKATVAARIAREVWSVQPGPVSSHSLEEIFSLRRDCLDRAADVEGPMSAGFRNGSAEGLSVFLKSPFAVNRRFALLRLVADHLTAPPEDKLLPATAVARTRRQKFQRAFAQEFLCPYSDLRDYLKSAEASDETVEDAAHYFDVSARMIETILANKGDLERTLVCQ